MHPDVPDEQAYFDRALDLRERLEANLDRAASLAADPKTAAELRRRVGALGVVDPAQSVAFGRIDATGDRFYIGKGAIWDEENDLVVVNWQAPVAAPFYTATPDNPEGLDRRRIFRCRDNRILGIEELVFNGISKAVAEGRLPEPVLTDTLLESLGRERSGELADIVATIQAAQYDVIARDAEQLLIVQGGPGTGKTVVGLHRVSWLLFNRREQLKGQDVLIVGPNPAFIRYLSGVLPALGEAAVVQMPLSDLGPRVRIGIADDPEVRRLKGDRRMLRLLLRGLRNRERVALRPVELTVEGRRVQLDGDRLAGRARQLAGQPHNDARRELRAFVIEEVQRLLTHRGFRDVAAFDIDVRGAAAREVDNYLERVWPNLTPQSFVLELFSTRRQLEAAAAGLLTTEEIDLLSLPRDSNVSTWLWSADDIPLLDMSDILLNGPPATYEHIVVDEAQDLSPMQLESIRRRSRTGYMTVLGDLAQATSPWAPASWEEVALSLQRDRVPTELAELSLGYRLPSEVHEVAMRLLPEIAPRLNRPEPLRSSGHPVTTTAAGVDELPLGVVAAVREVLGSGLLGVVTSDRDRPAITDALDAEALSWAPELQAASSPIVVLGAEGAKGLEFDNVIVVEPAQIAAESPQGLRALFVALTRPTRRLALVHAEPLPKVLGIDSPLPGDRPASAAGSGLAVAGAVGTNGAGPGHGFSATDHRNGAAEAVDETGEYDVPSLAFFEDLDDAEALGTDDEDLDQAYGGFEVVERPGGLASAPAPRPGARPGARPPSGEAIRPDRADGVPLSADRPGYTALPDRRPSEPPEVREARPSRDRDRDRDRDRGPGRDEPRGPMLAPQPGPGARPASPPARTPAAAAASPRPPSSGRSDNGIDLRLEPLVQTPPPERSERPGPPERGDRVDRADRADRHDPPERGDRIDRIDRLDQVDRVDRLERVGPIERRERGEPFGGLDREMANAVAAKLVEALSRYATPALMPLVVERMREIVGDEAPVVGELPSRPSSSAGELPRPAWRAGLPSPQAAPNTSPHASPHDQEP
jgi:DNA helicase IV